MFPLVSIITPCYNGRKFLERYFKSILSQTYQNLEVILVNDGSCDEPESIIEQYRCKLNEKGIEFKYLTKENGGAASAMNLGIKHFHGEYLTWIDVDDRMHDDYIEKKVQYLENNKDIELLITKCTYISANENNKIVGYSWSEFPHNREDFIHRFLLRKNFDFEPGNFMVRSSSFIKYNPDREIYESDKRYVGQNIQLLLPIAYMGKYAFLDESFYDYYIHNNNHHLRLHKESELLDAADEIQKTYFETIDRMDTDKKQELKNVVLIGCYFNRMDIAAKHTDKKLGQQCYRYLKEHHHLDKKNRLKFYISQSRILNKIYCTIKK